LTGKRIAVLGLGRSGLAVARAALAFGASPIVYDRSTREQILKPDVLDEAEQIGIDVVLGWDGAFVGPEHGLLTSGKITSAGQETRQTVAPGSEADAPGASHGDTDGDSLTLEGLTGLKTRATRVDLLIANPAVDSRSPVLREAVANGVEVISEVEFAFRIAKAPIIAITGTNGKTTTTVMNYLILQACGEKPLLCGNIFGSGYPEMTLTEAAMQASADQVLVAEISSFQLEWVRDFRPVSAGITNIVPDHQDRYDSFEDYARTKMRIFSAQGEGAFAVVRAYDPVVKAPGQVSAVSHLRPRNRPRRGASGQGSGDLSAGRPSPSPLPEREGNPEVLTFGAAGEQAEITEEHIRILDKTIPLETLPFSEPHNYQNAGMAALLAYGYLKWRAKREPESNAATVLNAAEDEAEKKRAAKRNVYHPRTSAQVRPALPEQIVEGLRHFHGVAHRMERLGSRNGVEVINNSMCTNPDAVLKSALAVEDLGKHILIGGVNKGLDFAPLKGFFSNPRTRAYIYGSDREQIQRMLGGTHPIFETMGEAFVAATQEARDGETIMLSPGCASSDQFQDFRDRGDVFRKIAKEWLDDTTD